MRAWTGRTLRVVAALLSTCVLAGQAIAECERVVSIGDLHGDVDGLEAILRETGLTDDTGAWAAGDDVCLVQLGDLVDRAPRSRDLIDRMMALAAARPDRVTVLLGNHEAMTLVGDLRDTHPAEFAAFAGEETLEHRAAAFGEVRERGAYADLDDVEARAAFDLAHPPGWFARRAAFAPDGRYGAWLLERPVAVRVGEGLYVHGGLRPAEARAGLGTVTRRVHREIRSFLDLRGRLERAGVLTPYAPFEATFPEVDAWVASVDGANPPPPEEVLADARAFLRLAGGLFVDPEGPLWNRTLADAPVAELTGPVEDVLAATGAVRIVVGHTPRDSHRIEARLDGRVLLTDTGAGPERDGSVSALVVTGETVDAVYPGGERDRLFAPPPTDAEIERFLREGRIVSMQEIGVGITKPRRVELELDGRTMRAAWKTVDVHETGIVRFEGGTEMNFTDDYRYERAAYLVDRMLGLHMVPVAVLRHVDGEDGTLVEWVEGAVGEKERAERKLRPDDPRRLTYQRSIMELFDALIRNRDRNLGNQLYTPADGRLHLIDHSRAFQTGKDLHDRFLAVPASLPPDLLDALRRLDVDTLRERLDGLLSKTEVKALIARRDKIVKKIEADVAQYGEVMVFQDRSILPPVPR